jgi:anaerobic selenocysteine-containing dehydrogenase
LPAWQAVAALFEDTAPKDGRSQWLDQPKPPMSAETLCQAIGRADLLRANGKFRFLPTDPGASATDTLPSFGKPDPDRYELLLVEAPFGTETFSMRSACLESLAALPCILLSDASARALSLQDGERIRLELPAGMIEAPIHIEERMAPHCLVLCRTPKLDWQTAGFGRIWLSALQIHRVKAASQGDCRC